MRTIGLIGGMTPESTLSYYGLLIRSARERLQHPDPLHNPVVVIYSLDLAGVITLQRTDRIAELSAQLARICEILRGAGAEVGALTANTPHLYLDAVRAGTSLELVSIVEAASNEVEARGLRRPLLLGTRTTMESPVYRERLASAGVEMLIPDEDGRRIIDDAIYGELAVGAVEPRTRERILALCREALDQRGADGVILACTELPLVITEADLSVPVLDTVGIHVNAILDRALA